MAVNIKKIGIAGAGAMGAGIAQVFAQTGYEVVLFDLSAAQLEKAKAEITKNLDFAVSKSKISQAGSPYLSTLSLSGTLRRMVSTLVSSTVKGAY